MVQWRKLERKDVNNDPLHRWLAWFDKNSPPELIEEVVMTDSAIAEAYRKLEEAIEEDEAGYRLYWAERKFEHDQVSRLDYAHDEGHAQGLAEGLTQGIEQGLTQGMAQTSLEIAQKMKEMGDSIERIQVITSLAPEVIEKL